MDSSKAQALDETLLRHWSATEFQVSDLSSMMAKRQCVLLDGSFLPPTVSSELSQEARLLLETQSEKRDVSIKSTGNTPRKYRSVGRDAVATHGQIIPALFRSDALLETLSAIAGEELHRVPYEPEEFIINSQSGSGDTHGWHWDDYAYALIHVVQAPDPLAGGRIEYIPDVIWDKDRSGDCLRRALEERTVQGMHVKSGQTYLMKTNTTLHRVSPLMRASERIAVVYSFANNADLKDDSITHSTMEEIYPKDTKVNAAAL